MKVEQLLRIERPQLQWFTYVAIISQDSTDERTVIFYDPDTLMQTSKEFDQDLQSISQILVKLRNNEVIRFSQKFRSHYTDSFWQT